MPTVEETLAAIEEALAQRTSLEVQRKRLESRCFRQKDPESSTIDDIQSLTSQILSAGRKAVDALKRFEQFPDHHHSRLRNQLLEFYKGGSFEDSIFIMTKYPDGDSQADQRLQAVIDAVCDGCSARGTVPRIAADKRHDVWLWGNVEVYMLGCKRGIAIVEDKYVPELNPNVAMEWGWMRALRRDVLFLREQSFAHARADWEGLLRDDFDWDNPVQGIEAALDGFLGHRGVKK